MSREAGIAGFFEEMELAPKGKEISVTAAANARADEIDATGMVTMRELTGFGVVTRKTVLKHLKAGEVVGRKVKVRGVDTWLFQPEHARLYLERVVDLTRAAIAAGSKRAGSMRAVVPEGMVTIVDLAARAKVSKWFVHDRLTDGSLEPAGVIGKGLKIFTEDQAATFVAEHTGAGRANRRKGTAQARPEPRPTPRERRPLVVTDRMVLVVLILDQPGETATALARDLGLAVSTVRNWALGNSLPDDDNAGRLVAYARGRYALRVGPDLDELGRQHRARYMENYMRSQRSADA